MPFLSFVFLSLQLILGTVVLLLVCLKWKPDLAKSLMIAFIATMFLIPSVLGITSLFIFEASVGNGYRRSPNFFDAFYDVLSFLHGLLPLFSAIILLGYIFARMKQSNQDANNSPPVLAATVDPATGTIHYPTPGPSWNTDLDGQQLVSLLRRREWAFLFDVLPSLAITSSSFWLIAMTVDGSRGSPIAGLLLVLAWIVNLLTAIYLPLKDCVNGISFGKALSGCRVVDFTTGKPIGPGLSVARNILFLVPLMALVEVLVASVRPDRRRLGDLLANTIVVSGPPNRFNGVELEIPPPDQTSPGQPPTPHPLDD